MNNLAVILTGVVIAAALAIFGDPSNQNSNYHAGQEVWIKSTCTPAYVKRTSRNHIFGTDRYEYMLFVKGSRDEMGFVSSELAASPAQCLWHKG